MNSPHQEWLLDTHRLGRRVLVFDRLDSTNDLAAQLGGDPANEGLAILADEQTAGRGQHGRSWLASPGQSVLLSLLVSPPPQLCRPAILTAWAAVAVCATIQQSIGAPPRIKWPNDVLLHGLKVCGILIESGNPKSATQHPFSAERESQIYVVGIGLNVRQSAATFTAAGLLEATSLSQFADYPLETHAIAVDLIRQLDREYDRLCQGDLGTLEERWREQLDLLGKQVVVECSGALHHGCLTQLSFRRVELARPGRPALELAPEQIQHLWQANGPNPARWKR